MWYLRKFPTIVDYEAYKNNPDEFLVPGVSYVVEVNSCFYDPMPEPEVVLHPVIHAKFNATSENMLAFADTTQIKALKINGNVVDFEPPVVNTVMINALASEITINSDDSGSFPADYVQKCSNIIIKPTDSSLKCTDFENIVILTSLENSQLASVISIEEFIATGMCSYNETDNTLVLNNITGLGVDTMGVVFAHLDENTEKYTPIDTTCTFTVITGGLESPYMFEAEGEYEVEIELIDNGSMRGLFNQSCITELISTKDITQLFPMTFNSCSYLTLVNIGNGIKIVNTYAFYNCPNVTTINLLDGVTTLDFASLVTTAISSITIPDSVTSIGYEVFPNSVAEFKGKFATDDKLALIVNDRLIAFASASGVTTYIIPDGVTSIGEWVFSNCDSLTEVTIPNSVTSIGEWVFSNCDSLTSIVIPEGVTEIGRWAFGDCMRLASVYCEAIIPPVAVLPESESWQAFHNAIMGDEKIYVPMESVDAYKSADGWSEYADHIEGYNF